jgi:hypothetical protein
MMKARVKLKGDGYSPLHDSITTYISLALISLYVVIALLHIGYSLHSGLLGESWDSVLDLAALALGSCHSIVVMGAFVLGSIVSKL